MPDDVQQVLVFNLGDEEYAIPVMNSREIIKTEDKSITSIPESSEFIKGITNVRGKVIPLIDLKNRFELDSGEEEFIVLIDLHSSTAGILVDEVEEVMEINDKRIKEAPELLKKDIHSDYVEDVALLEDDRMITILDLERGFGEEETTQVSQMTDEEPEEEEIEEVSEEEIMKKAREKIS